MQPYFAHLQLANSSSYLESIYTCNGRLTSSSVGLLVVSPVANRSVTLVDEEKWVEISQRNLCRAHIRCRAPDNEINNCMLE